MSKWTEGYVEGLDYSYAYQAELNPLRLPLTLLNAGIAAPATDTACELGFGQGVSANLFAAASSTQWFGTDFNAAQAGFARELASVSGAQAKFFDQSFAEFCERTDLPNFDFIGLHGVWSWISDENRRILVDFFRRKLNVGGVVYVSYNTQPGFAALLPIQEIFARYAESLGPAGPGLAGTIQGAVEFAIKLIAASPRYAHAYPDAAEQLNSFRSADASYLAHEYFNRNWVPTSFSRLAEWLAPAKLEYACTAHYFTAVDAWNVSSEQQAMLEGIHDPVFRETVRDVMVKRSFRADYWVKGLRRLTPLERVAAINAQRVLLIRQPGDIPFKATGALGEFTLADATCRPVLDALADHRPKRLGEIEQAVRDKGLAHSQVIEVVMALMQIGGVAPVQDDATIRSSRAQTDKLNDFLCERSLYRGDIEYLASPVIGAGFREIGGRVAQFFLHALKHGKRQPAELAAHAWQIFRLQGLALLNQGKPVESSQENLAALTNQAAFFIEKQLPVLQALQIA